MQVKTNINSFTFALISSLETHSSSHENTKKGVTQLVDGKPVVPPKPGKPTSPQAPVNTQVNQLFLLKLFVYLILDGP